jgi:hypothetical protein
MNAPSILAHFRFAHSFLVSFQMRNLRGVQSISSSMTSVLLGALTQLTPALKPSQMLQWYRQPHRPVDLLRHTGSHYISTKWCAVEDNSHPEAYQCYPLGCRSCGPSLLSCPKPASDLATPSLPSLHPSPASFECSTFFAPDALPFFHTHRLILHILPFLFITMIHIVYHKKRVKNASNARTEVIMRVFRYEHS